MLCLMTPQDLLAARALLTHIQLAIDQDPQVPFLGTAFQHLIPQSVQTARDAPSQKCDLAQQSIVHIVQSPHKNSQNKEEAEDNHVGGTLKALEREPESLTRIDLSTSILPSLSAGLAVILDPGKNSVSLPSEKTAPLLLFNMGNFNGVFVMGLV
ncbi:hypothetical protein WISP_101702 [Willisornis vidua]|uniref:Uncharacterized protein n=1 Tax=Willisornis vidua TaxID=1566151 RepID=A0ABQ9CYJ7_9PASS|nr:hypothetical protein WISP_101702 [Willisornis vidua]